MKGVLAEAVDAVRALSGMGAAASGLDRGASTEREVLQRLLPPQILAVGGYRCRRGGAVAVLAPQLRSSPHLRVELPYPSWRRRPVHGRLEEIGGTHGRHWGWWMVEIRRRRSRRRPIQVPVGSRLRPGPGNLLRRRARIEGYGIHAPHCESRAGEGDDRPCPLGICGETD